MPSNNYKEKKGRTGNGQRQNGQSDVKLQTCGTKSWLSQPPCLVQSLSLESVNLLPQMTSNSHNIFLLTVEQRVTARDFSVPQLSPTSQPRSPSTPSRLGSVSSSVACSVICQEVHIKLFESAKNCFLTSLILASRVFHVSMRKPFFSCHSHLRVSC